LVGGSKTSDIVMAAFEKLNDTPPWGMNRGWFHKRK